ncbi:MAG: hypothetical protein ACOX63_10690 [Christensenellales bacterium]|jgi:hypothetical protein
MRKHLCIVLSVLYLILLPAPALGQHPSADQQLRDALSQTDSRSIALANYQTLPDTGQRCALFVTSNEPVNSLWSSTDFAFWFIMEGQEPQLLFEGQDQPPPEDQWMDDRVYPRKYLQGFVHKGNAYFIVSAQTGERQSNYSLLYWVHNSQANLIGSYYAGAAYHPDVGLYKLDYDYGTDPPFEAGRELTPVFLSLDGGHVTRTEGIAIEYGELLQVPNGDYALRDLEEQSIIPSSQYYLPNHMLVINCEFYDAKVDMTILKSVYLGIENGCAQAVRYTNDLEQPDVNRPFWTPEAHASDAASNGHYRIYHSSDEEVIRPRAFLSPRDDLLTLYTSQSRVQAEEAPWEPAAGENKDMSSRLAQLMATAKWGRATPGQVEALASIALAADDDIKSLFQKTLGMYRVGSLEHSGLYTAFGHDLNNDQRIDENDLPPNSINLEIDEDERSTLRPWYTFFHEAGHAIDVNLGRRHPDTGRYMAAFSQEYRTTTVKYDDVTLEDAARFDVSENLRDAVAKFTTDTAQADRVFTLIWSRYTESHSKDPADYIVMLQVKGYYNYLFQQSGYTISDIYGGATDNRIFLTESELALLNATGVFSYIADKVLGLGLLESAQLFTESPGHTDDDDYWYKAGDGPLSGTFSRTGALPMELFAGYFSSRMRNNQKELQYYSFFLPESVQILEEMVVAMLEVADQHTP